MACTNLDFLKVGDISLCMYRPVEIIVDQRSTYNTFAVDISIKDWLGMFNNFPLKNNKCYDKESYWKMKKIMKGLRCLKI